jgi:hypothetical protein
MRSFKNRRFRAIVAVHFAALAVGVGAAISTPFGPTDRATAANHCTNYFPVSFQPDSSCFYNNWMTGNTWGETSGVAQRDQNCMWVVSDRSLRIWYDEAGESNAFGIQLCQGPYPGYVKAGCKLVSTNGVNGRCVTNWHD